MSEFKRLLKRFAAVIGFAFVLSLLIETGWSTNAPISVFMDNAAEVLFGELPWGNPDYLLITSGLGVYFGILTLLILDWRKFYQGLLLIVGSLVATVLLTASGLLLADVPVTRTYVAAGLAAYLGVVIIGWLFLAIDTSQERDPGYQNPGGPTSQSYKTEVRGIIPVTLGILVGVGVIGWAQLTFTGAFTIVDLVAFPTTFLYVYVIFGFITYDSMFSVSFVGAGGAGKTWALIGLYESFNERNEIPTDRTRDFGMKYQNAENMGPDDSFEVIPPTQGTDDVGFSISVGDMFPMRVRFDLRDFEGEWIDEIAEFFENHSRLYMALRYPIVWVRYRFGNLEGGSDTHGQGTEATNGTEAEESPSGIDSAGGPEPEEPDYGPKPPEESDSDDGPDLFDPVGAESSSSEEDPEPISDGGQTSEPANLELKKEMTKFDIWRSNLVILIIDGEAVYENETAGRQEISEIASKLHKRPNVTLLLVATKCDHFVHDYLEERRGSGRPVDVEPGDSGVPILPREELYTEDGESDFTSFSEYVTDRLKQRGTIHDMLRMSDRRYIHPVYFGTEDGAPKVKGESGPPERAGFDALAETIEWEARKNVVL